MMKKLSRIFSVCIVCSMLLVIGGCSKTTAKTTIKIAVAGPMTGDNSEYGIGFKNAVELMIKQWNAKGGVLKNQIELVVYDDKNSPEEGANVGQKIASDKSIIGVIGHFSSGVTMTATPTYQDNKIILIAPSASHPDFTKQGNFIFRNNAVISTEAKEVIDLAVNYHKAKKIGILAIKTDWGTSTKNVIVQIIKDQYAAKGIEVVDVEEVVEGSDDYTPNITKMKQAGVDTIIGACMYATLAPFTKQYKLVDPSINIVGFSNAYTQNLLNLGGKSVEGLTFPVIFFSQSTEANVASFVTEYKAAYNSVPSSLTAQAYDSVGILLTAIKQVGSLDRDKIRDAIAGITYAGVTGSTTFNATRDAVKPFNKVVIKDGQFTKLAY